MLSWTKENRKIPKIHQKNITPEGLDYKHNVYINFALPKLAGSDFLYIETKFFENLTKI